MSDPDHDTAAHFSRRAEAYAASPSHARGADLDSEWQAAFAGAGLRVTDETVWAKRHNFALWVGRAGIDATQIAALEARVLGAPTAIREALFEIEAGSVRALCDTKAIYRLERV